MISKICYNLTDLMSLWVKQRWLWPVKNIDLVCEKQPSWNERAAVLYSTAGEVKYANKYVLDFVSLVCRSSGRCYLITVLSRQLWRDEPSSVIIFKELKDLLFFVCLFFRLLDIFKWVKSVTLPHIWLLVLMQHFTSLAEPDPFGPKWAIFTNTRVLEHAHRALADH